MEWFSCATLLCTQRCLPAIDTIPSDYSCLPSLLDKLTSMLIRIASNAALRR
eukprot:COSAG02_NODE_66467_length_255_cov_0.705128_1_plen_51_part_10